LQTTLAELIERDAAAYTQVLAAYRLPKVSEDEKATRSAAIQAALKQAARTPLEIAAACAEVLGLAGEVAELGIPSAASDAAVAALLAHAGLRGAALNVAVNLESIKDSEFILHADELMAGLLQSSAPALDEALAPLGREG
jgi:formiminotetrahydrofolate cyclodeaminase